MSGEADLNCNVSIVTKLLICSGKTAIGYISMRGG